MPEARFFPGTHPSKRRIEGHKFAFDSRFKTRREAQMHADWLRERYGYSARVIPKFRDPFPYAVYQG